MHPTNTIELSGLEYQVNHLLRSLEQLQVENASLRQKLATSARERSALSSKQQLIISKVKKIITQLKEEMI